MAKAKELQSLSMMANGNMVGVSWETGQGTAAHARWHVWLELDKEASESRHHSLPGLPVTPYRVRESGKGLRKNPPLGARHGSHGKWLDDTAKANAPMVEQALCEAERLGLYQQALDRNAAEEAARVDAIRDEAAADMLHAARQLADEGLPGAREFFAQVCELSVDQQARMLQIIQNASHSRKANG